MASAPTPGTTPNSNARQAEDDGLKVILDGETYVVRFADLSAMDTSALRKETGLSVAGIMAAAESDPDLDVIAAVVWLARRTNGEPKLRFEAVARKINYSSDLSFGLPEGTEDEEEAADPLGSSDGTSEATSQGSPSTSV